MNYEEMLNAQEGVAQHQEQLPLGTFYRKQIDRKYRNVVELKHELADSLVFCQGLRSDQQVAAELDDSHQLRYDLKEDSGGIYELELQQGSYQTLAQLLNSDPAILASKGFIDQTVADLMELTQKLHERGIFQLCYAPQMVFMRKSDNAPMLLCHGSSFLEMKDQAALYAGYEDMVAPELLDGGQVDERSDVYALGRFIEALYDKGEMPYEYKAVVKKATEADPSKRFSTVHEMQKALASKRGMKRSFFMGIGAFAVVALLVFLYFDMTPETSNVEFVDGNGLVTKTDPFSETYDDPLVNDQEEYLDPEIAMYMDSIGLEEMSEEEFKALADSVKQYTKVEEIFRRRFEQKANSKLSGLYSSGNLGSSESNFVAHSQSVMQELMDYAAQLGEQTGIPQEQASSMATQIISRTQAQLQQGVTRFGSMTKSSSDEE